MIFETKLIDDESKKRIQKGIKTYTVLQKAVGNESSVLDNNFQKEYCNYYRLNRCYGAEEDKEKYFAIFEEERKTKVCDFKQILTKLTCIKGKLWISFASKMVASIDPTKPVWDQEVLERLYEDPEIRFPKTVYVPKTVKNKMSYQIEKYVERYNMLKEHICKLKEEAAQPGFFDAFRKEFEGAENLTGEKILDFYLWGTRKDK